MSFNLPFAVIEIMEIFKKFGFEAYMVGGCVRDSIMGTKPHDWDITTNALPNQIIECFKGYKIIETGLKHGTITILINGEQYEVTTFRIDGNYSDNRRPDSVTFTSSLESDLSRRDFTINALAYNPLVGIIDPFNGCEDIKNKQIKCVGNPDDRFNEDALRILRALRFSSVLDFTIDHDTDLSIHNNRELLKNISAERIRVELCKLIMGVNAGYILENYYDVISVFMPEITPMVGFNQNNPYHYLDVWQHTIQTILKAKSDIYVRLTMLLHDIGKPATYIQDENGVGHFYGHPQVSSDMAYTIMQRLKFDNEAINIVKSLTLYHDASIDLRRKSVKRWLNKVGEDKLRRLLEVKRADILGQSIFTKDDRLRQIDEVEVLVNEIIEQQQCFSLKDLKINGHDLISMGLKPSIIIGKILNQLLEMVIEEQINNEYWTLLSKAKELVLKGSK